MRLRKLVQELQIGGTSGEHKSMSLQASQESPKVRAVDVEAFARNVACLVEEGGRALAAYLKPREQGLTKDDPPVEIADAVKTLSSVAEYWLSDPARALALQTMLGKAYLDLWAHAAKRLAGEAPPPIAAPDPRDRRFADP